MPGSCIYTNADPPNEKKKRVPLVPKHHVGLPAPDDFLSIALRTPDQFTLSALARAPDLLFLPAFAFLVSQIGHSKRRQTRRQGRPSLSTQCLRSAYFRV